MPQFGVTYQHDAPPLRPSQKFRVWWRTSVDPATIVIAGIEAVQMIRKGQVLGITRKNLHGQAWVFGALLGIN